MPSIETIKMTTSYWDNVLLVIWVVLLILAFVIFGFISWRPMVTQWKEVHSPHSARAIEVPERIKWMGVEYECTLVPVDKASDQ